jgi:hypothetical protein
MKNYLRAVIVVAAINLTFSNMSQSLAQQPPMVGGYQAANKSDPNVVSAAKFAVNKERVKHGGRVSLISIERAETQVVAGINYRLCLRVKQNGKTQNVATVVYQNLQQRYSLSSWQKVASCQIPS